MENLGILMMTKTAWNTHIAIEHPSGKYLDAQGLRSNAEISEDFGLDYMDSYEISRDQLIHLLSDDGPFDCWLDDT